MSETDLTACRDASLLRQLAAMIYDSLLIFAVLFFASAIALLFNGGEAIEAKLWFKLYLLLTVFTYYAWFWNKSGQTLGMRAWKIRIITDTGANPAAALCRQEKFLDYLEFIQRTNLDFYRS